MPQLAPAAKHVDVEKKLDEYPCESEDDEGREEESEACGTDSLFGDLADVEIPELSALVVVPESSTKSCEGRQVAGSEDADPLRWEVPSRQEDDK